MVKRAAELKKMLFKLDISGKTGYILYIEAIPKALGFLK